VLDRSIAAAAAGDLDEAVQALKATTSNAEMPSGQADSRWNGASGLTDDDLKPSFMRRLAADQSPNGVTLPARNSLQTGSPAKERPPDDINPRPIARRRIDTASDAKQAAAKAVLQASVCPVFSEYQAEQWLSAHLYDQTVSSIGKPLILPVCTMLLGPAGQMACIFCQVLQGCAGCHR